MSVLATVILRRTWRMASKDMSEDFCVWVLFYGPQK